MGNDHEQHYDLLKALVDKKPEEARFQTGLHLHMMLKEQETVTQRYPSISSSSIFLRPLLFL